MPAMSSIAPLSILSAVAQLSSSLEGWTLLESDTPGTRSYRYEIQFEREFGTVPIVQLGVVGLDSSKDDNLRLRVRAEAISERGFTLLLETWLHSQLWSVDVSWLAIGS